MEETIDVKFNVQFDFALEVWFSIVCRWKLMGLPGTADNNPSSVL